MLRTTFFFFFLFAFFASGVSQQTPRDTIQKCKSKWTYLKMEKSIIGSIVYYEQPTVLCGTVATASVALVKTDIGDTIRILFLCDTKKDFNTPPSFKPGERVSVIPGEDPTFRIDIHPLDPEACRLLTTYFGTILHLN